MKVARFLTDMKKRDLLLLGFVGIFFLFMGTVTGVIPSPLLQALAQHEQILKDHSERKGEDKKIVEIAKLQLYLARESCLHGAKTESERGRCDRQSIRDAILDDIIPLDLDEASP